MDCFLKSEFKRQFASQVNHLKHKSNLEQFYQVSKLSINALEKSGRHLRADSAKKRTVSLKKRVKLCIFHQEAEMLRCMVLIYLCKNNHLKG